MYARCQELAAHGRDCEARAHELLRGSAAEIAEAPFLTTWLRRIGLLPREDLGPAGHVLFGADASILAAGVAVDWAMRSRYGRFAPRDANGLYVSPASRAAWRNLLARTRERNWQPRQGDRVPYRRLRTAGRWLGMAGAGIVGGLSGYDQWQADADNPQLGRSERVARAVTQGGSTAFFAWAGGAGGAALGATGFAANPVTGVVGVLGGGYVGGIAGAEFGERVGEVADGWVGTAVDAGAGLMSGGVDAAGQVLGEVGDAAMFWR